MKVDAHIRRIKRSISCLEAAASAESGHVEIPAELAGLDTEQGCAMRDARENGAVVIVSSEAGDPWADSIDEVHSEAP